MKTLFIVFLILAFLILIPVPIKISMFYSSDNYYLKVYKFEIISKSKFKKENTFFKRKLNMVINKYKNRSDEESDNTTSIFASKVFLKKLIYNLNNNTHKPVLKFNGVINYSLGDSAYTAISYGLISTLSSFVYKGLSIFLKVKKSKFDINPIFKDSVGFNFIYSSILFISLGKVIYIFILFLKTFLQFKEVTLFKGKL
ncbi:MAG: DUF2953 domain-containing protein [Clostridium sp.]|uniref:DUF2953 domain-containing protein n=1 Tax=Clostridium sp. TaxID=1506 RepID=UPI003F3CE32D